jgi:magnesium-protoporphyrin O-methyltransferase
MDSLIHYQPRDIIAALAALQRNTRSQDSRILFTFAPRTPALMLMKSMGKLFPRADRSPFIEPIQEQHLRWLIEQQLSSGTRVIDTQRISSMFYKSQGMQISCPAGVENV